ncbi:hypothetical protein SLEP1_g43147 [Rubroshorea leprosula]|uniref:Uncharacterized protein n=1 Tax=Rubroshorea leprosula TaxID=152421 RepID=A0AAV5LC22_9ROSI|nr:hypothetical protein SLEP1_g43147 [Rubroshorea leprosula]
MALIADVPERLCYHIPITICLNSRDQISFSTVNDEIIAKAEWSINMNGLWKL